MSEIAVTGAAGQLGRAVVRRLIAAGVAVRGYDMRRWPDAPMPYCELDLSRTDAAFEWPDSVTSVLHLAGYRDLPEITAGGIADLMRANVESLAGALAACGDNVRAFVYVSSMAVYAPCAPVPTRETEPPAPKGLYGLSKLLGEHACNVFRNRRPDCQLAILRLAQIYGPGSPPHLAIYQLIDKGRRMGRLELQCVPSLARDFLFLSDAAEALALAAAGELDGIFNVGGGRAVSMAELVDAVADALDRPTNVAFGEHAGADRVLDSQTFAERVGFTPRVTLRDGIRREVARLCGEDAP